MVAEFKEVEGYNGKYKVNMYGAVLSFKRNPVVALKQRVDNRGYLYVMLCRKSKYNSENEIHSYKVLGKKSHTPEHLFFKGKKSINSKRVGHFLGDKIIQKFYTVYECAEYFGKHPSNISRHIRIGGVYKNLNLKFLDYKQLNF